MATRRTKTRGAREGRDWLADSREFRSRVSNILLGLFVFFSSDMIFAAQVQVDLLTIGQGYQTRTISGELLDRSRVTQWASLRAVDLWGVEGISLQLQMRFDTDFGLWLRDQKNDTDNLELMSFLLLIKGMAPWFDVDIGRQVLVDEIDFLEFDGVDFHIHLPWGLRLSLLSGFAVRNRSWLGGGMLELDGVEQGDIPAPVIGASLAFAGDWLEARMDYRREMLWEAGWPIESECMALGSRTDFIQHRLGVEGSAAYDLAQDEFRRLHARVWARVDWPWRGVRVETGFLRSRPHFSLDSIFSFFSPAPFWQVSIGLRAGFTVSNAWRTMARLDFYHRDYSGKDVWQGPGTGLVSSGGMVDGVELEARLSIGARSWTWLYSGLESGAAGRRWLLSPGVRWELLNDVLGLDARGILLELIDGYDSRYDIFNLGASVATRWTFGKGRAVIASAELNSNRINTLSFKMLLMLDLSFSYGPGGYN